MALTFDQYLCLSTTPYFSGNVSTLLLKTKEDWEAFCSYNKLFIWDMFNNEDITEFKLDNVKIEYLIDKMEHQLLNSRIFIHFLDNIENISEENLTKLLENPCFKTIKLDDYQFKEKFYRGNPELMKNVEQSLFENVECLDIPELKSIGCIISYLKKEYLKSKYFTSTLKVLEKLTNENMIKNVIEFYIGNFEFEKESNVIEDLVDIIIKTNHFVKSAFIEMTKYKIGEPHIQKAYARIIESGIDILTFRFLSGKV